MGKPDATALENLELVLALEQLSGRCSVLVFIGGWAKLDGRVVAAWRYQFAEDTTRVVEWEVSPAGGIILLPSALWSGYRMEEKGISSSLRLDSPAISVRSRSTRRPATF